MFTFELKRYKGRYEVESRILFIDEDNLYDACYLLVKQNTSNNKREVVFNLLEKEGYCYYISYDGEDYRIIFKVLGEVPEKFDEDVFINRQMNDLEFAAYAHEG
jgi:hypothetical protein|nr:MAG TPA: hypothetical protein [Bacteriophage sp.]